MDSEDISVLQAALGILTNQPINPNGHFGHYTDKLVRNWQEQAGMMPDGIVNTGLWEKILSIDKDF